MPIIHGKNLTLAFTIHNINQFIHEHCALRYFIHINHASTKGSVFVYIYNVFKLSICGM